MKMFSQALNVLARPSLTRANTGATAALGARFISYSKLTIEQTKDKSRLENLPAKEDLKFGTIMSDHMLTIEWTQEEGWGAPKIVPFQNLSISPAASGLQYGTCREYTNSVFYIESFFLAVIF